MRHRLIRRKYLRNICGSVNSVRIHYSRLKKSTFMAESKKKKKEAETRFAPKRGCKTIKPNRALDDYSINFFTPAIKIAA